MKERLALDVSHLPLHGMNAASLTWWGTLAFMLIEGTGFVLAIAIYLYLASIAVKWPTDAPPPDLLAGSAVTILLAVSVIPNLLISRWAQQKDLAKVRLGIVVMSVFGIAPLCLRAFEFPAMHINWDTNAYGSIVWVILGLHTSHIVTDLIETLVLACLMFTRHADNPRRYGDVQDNAMYWNFVVLTWVPLYICLYWIPRL